MKKCTRCKAFQPESEFYKDSTRADGLQCRCKQCESAISYERTIARPKTGNIGRRRLPIRDGDRTQARTRIRVMVAAGEIPDPNTLPCFDCGRQPTRNKKHEYDHYAGYGIEGHNKVQAVCRVCHRRRERERKAMKQL